MDNIRADYLKLEKFILKIFSNIRFTVLRLCHVINMFIDQPTTLKIPNELEVVVTEMSQNFL